MIPMRQLVQYLQWDPSGLWPPLRPEHPSLLLRLWGPCPPADLWALWRQVSP